MRLVLGDVLASSAVYSPGKSALGKGWGLGGKIAENAFSSFAAKRLGPPAPEATQRGP